MNVLYELLYNEPTKVMLLGPGCSMVSTFVGQAAHIWNLNLMSYGSSSPALSDRARFPTFFRTHPSATLHNPTRIKLFQRFHWRNIATIQQTKEVFTSTIEDLEDRVNRINLNNKREDHLEITIRASFLTEPANAVRNLKRHDARIIVGVFYADMALKVFCEAYKQQLYGPRVVWFIIGWYADNWYTQTDGVNCTVDQMRDVLEGHFTTEGVMLNPQKNASTDTNMTAEQFTSRIKERLNHPDPLSVTGYVEAPLAYDAVWALALALNRTQAELERNNTSLADFDYTRTDIRKEIYRHLSETNFTGVSGRVAFDSDGDRIALTQIEQMRNGTYYRLGFYDLAQDQLLEWSDDSVYWPAGSVPKSERIDIPVPLLVPHSLFLVITCLALVGILCSAAALIFNRIYSYRRILVSSQPVFNNVFQCGCILCYICAVLYGLDGRYLHAHQFQLLCQVRMWLLSLAFTLSFGPLFAKIWAVYRMTTRQQHSRDVMPFHAWEMYLILGVMLTLDVLVLISWQWNDPLTRHLESFPPEDDTVNNIDVRFKPQLERCNCKRFNIWIGVIFGYKGVVLLLGLLLSYEIRNVTVKHVNDARFVVMCIYNIAVLSLIVGGVTFIINTHHYAGFAFVAVAILLCCYLSTALLYLPKITHVIENPTEGIDIAGIADAIQMQHDEQKYKKLVEENAVVKQQLELDEEILRLLRAELDEKLGPQNRVITRTYLDPRNQRVVTRLLTNDEADASDNTEQLTDRLHNKRSTALSQLRSKQRSHSRPCTDTIQALGASKTLGRQYSQESRSRLSEPSGLGPDIPMKVLNSVKGRKPLKYLDKFASFGSFSDVSTGNVTDETALTLTPETVRSQVSLPVQQAPRTIDLLSLNILASGPGTSGNSKNVRVPSHMSEDTGFFSEEV